jgi:hypothetical protein
MLDGVGDEWAMRRRWTMFAFAVLLACSGCTAHESASAPPTESGWWSADPVSIPPRPSPTARFGEIPDVRYLPLDEARAWLERAGYVHIDVLPPIPGGPPGLVTLIAPEPGHIADPETTTVQIAIGG